MGEIKVTVSANKPKSVSIKSQQVANEISASADTGRIWAQTSKNWAVSDVIVENTDYSSKYYANQAKESASNAEEFESATRIIYNSFSETVNNVITDVQTARDEALTSVESGKIEAVDSINSTKSTVISDIEFVADGEKKEIEDLADLIKENAEDIANRTSFAMFDTILKDHVLTYEESKGLALQGTYVYKEAIAGSRYGYPDFYNKCLEEFNETRIEEYVLSNSGVKTKIYVHSNGHRYYDIKDKSEVDAFFNSKGMAWLYGIDTENERIFLPRNNWFDQATVDTSQVNINAEAGLPNITGGFNSTSVGYNNNPALSGLYGAFARGAYNTSTQRPAVAEQTSSGWADSFDASRSNPIYGKSNTVQPNAVKKLLYICVGNTVADTSWVDVVTQVQGGVKDLENATNEGLEALANASNALRTTQITNCITEIPQRIKLELNNGVLTLKAGSVVTVPNGFEADDITPKFDYITISNDLTRSIAFSGSYNDVTVCYDATSKSLGDFRRLSTETGSGTGTIEKGYYFNSANNKVFYYNSTADGKNYSLPIGLFSNSATTITSIDQVFNGFGYIGSTVWVDKGVKGLIPNGRNEDGTLRNIEIETTNVITRTSTYTYKTNIGIISSKELVFIGVNDLLYNEGENYFYFNGSKSLQVVIGTCQLGSPITNFQPKPSFRAMEYNDTQWVVNCCMPDYANQIFGTGSGWIQVKRDSFVCVWASDGYAEDYRCLVSPDAGTNNYVVGYRYDDFNGNTQITSFTFLCPKDWYFHCNSEGTPSYRIYPLKGAN